MNKTQQRNGQKAVSSPSPRKANSKSLRTTKVLILLIYLVKFMIPCFSIVSNWDLRKFFGKIRTKKRNCSTTTWILIICWRSTFKNIKITLLFVDFSKAFDSIQRGKMEKILLPHGCSKETVTAIMMLFKTCK